jgi:putative membrane protein
MKRLHPAMFVMLVGPFARRFGALIIILLISSKGREIGVSLGVLGIGACLSLLMGAVHYLTTWYGVIGDKLEFRTGWIWTKHKVVPLERIQSVHIEQSLLQRLLHVAAARIDTGVTNKSDEVHIAAIGYEDAQRLRQRLLQRVHLPTEAGVSFELPESTPALFTLTLGELAMHGFAHNRWLYVMGAVWGLSEFSGNGQESFIRTVVRFYDVQPGDQVFRIIFSVIGLLIVGWLVSIFFSVTQFYGFTLHRHPKGLSIDRGLFTRKQTVVPLNRVSGAEIHANFLMRWLGMCSLTVHILGSRHEEEGGGKMMITPWVARHRLEPMLQMVLPQASTKPGSWKRVPMRSVGRHMLGALVGWATFLLGLFSLAVLIYAIAPSKPTVHELLVSRGEIHPWVKIGLWIGAVMLVLTTLGTALMYALTARARVTEHTVEQQRGWLNRTWFILPIGRTQMAELDSTVVQRWFNLRSLQIMAPAMRLRALDMEPADAETIFEHVRAERRRIKTRGV